MIADALRYEVELHAHRLRVDNRFLRLAREGAVEPRAIGRYLVALRFMIGNTPPNLRLAAKRAADEGRTDLASYYAEKCQEEDGHERWAEDDLAAFVAEFGFRPQPEPVPAFVELQRMLHSTIELDPVLYLSYVFWAEYFVVLVGGEFIECLVQRCGLPPQTLTCLAKHVVLDEGHTDENIANIDRLVSEPRYLEPMRATLRTAMALFDRATEQMLESQLELERAAS